MNTMGLDAYEQIVCDWERQFNGFGQNTGSANGVTDSYSYTVLQPEAPP